jgi:polygalacturonase
VADNTSFDPTRKSGTTLTPVDGIAPSDAVQADSPAPLAEPEFKGQVPVTAMPAQADQRTAAARTTGSGVAMQPIPIVGAQNYLSASPPVTRVQAANDGSTEVTGVIQAAIDACPPGGVVSLPAGVYLSGMITLKSNMIFRLEQGATLKGTLDVTKYRDTSPPTDNDQLSNCKKALIYAQQADNVIIEGPGTIDGSGEAPQWNGKEPTRPMAIFTAMCTNVTIRDLAVKNAAMWAVVNLEGDGVTVRNVDVDSTIGATRDGIDLVDCHQALVEGCTVKSEDDSICIKSGSLFGVKDVLVRNCTINGSGVANGLKFGTASKGSFENVTFDTIQVSHVEQAAMAVESVDGASIKGITFKNITIDDVGTPFFVLLGARNPPENIGSIDGVTFSNIRGNASRHSWGALISGVPATPDGTAHPVQNISFEDVDLVMKGGLAKGEAPTSTPEYEGGYPDPRQSGAGGVLSAWGMLIRHADGVSMKNVKLRTSAPDARKAIARRQDVENWSQVNLSAQ